MMTIEELNDDIDRLEVELAEAKDQLEVIRIKALIHRARVFSEIKKYEGAS